MKKARDAIASGNGMSGPFVGLGVGGGVGLFGSRALFPLAPRHAPLSIGWCSGDDGTWKRLGWVGKVAEANDGTAGSNGMVDPRVGLGDGGVAGFVGSQALFPPAPRKRLGWVGKVAEANNGTAGGNGTINL